ncbi:peptide/nickel transport system permease protein [Roseovarius pacificus]|uniref:Peptide/nickel transport system permease protein n=2 Tax=Roseovarius pacificus TaxID=337701 RepID=A0A1M7A1C5_9RHOB|nr:ABC transporter permease [Roseovarius pacificus]GGO54003.1 peptide ABC transporter [Roseovarius pacificus]SHL36476.1 peptide/nickel transport system permease protein [Roseovarius pacificus]
MLAMILSRIAIMIPNVIILTFLLFAAVTSFLGTPAAIMLGEDASPEAIAELNARLGFDGPLLTRYWDWMSSALSGDLGRSYSTQQAVSDMVAAALPLTLELALWAIAVAVIGTALINSIPVFRGVVERVTAGISIIGITVPNFFLGLLLIYIFSVQFRWLPTTGWAPWSDGVITHLRHMILPVATLCFFYFSSFSLVFKAEYKSIENSLFIKAARAKGISEARISYRHILPNSMMPLITYAGLSLGQLVGGAVVTETVFSMPGMGRLLVDAISARDFPVMLAVGMIIIVGVMLLNLLADLTYGLVNPLVRTAT